MKQNIFKFALLANETANMASPAKPVYRTSVQAGSIDLRSNVVLVVELES
jgi:hypothetical protein